MVKGDVKTSALAEHAWHSGHNIAFDEVSIVDKDSRYYSRLAKEAICIRQQKQPLNRDRGVLPDIYDSIISS